MILADKIINLRKKNGWSQEQLAEQLNVSRQSVSKWEGAQSTPELEKIIQMSNIFEVTTDYLIRDEIEDEFLGQDLINQINSESSTNNVGQTEGVISNTTNIKLKKVSLKDAQEFLSLKEQMVVPFAIAVFLFIISPIPLLLLNVGVEARAIHISENWAAALGLVSLMFLVLIGVVLIMKCTLKLKKYKFIETDSFETEYGVTGLVKEKKNAFQTKYSTNIIIGVALCILSMFPLFFSIGFDGANEFLQILGVCTLILIVGLAVTFFIKAVLINNSYEQLLQEGEYSIKKKSKSGLIDIVAGIYWTVVITIYVGYSLITGKWQSSWVIWPIACLAFGAVAIVTELIENKLQK